MRNWESGDDVMEEHARYYPTCEHVLIAKGRKYIQRVEAGEHPDREPAPSVAVYINTYTFIFVLTR